MASATTPEGRLVTLHSGVSPTGYGIFWFVQFLLCQLPQLRLWLIFGNLLKFLR